MDVFEAGAAIADISPGDDWFEARRAMTERNPEEYRTASFTTGVAEPIYARTLVIRQGDRLMVMITADLAGLEPWLLAQVREELSRRPGFAAATIAVTVSHTHSGPPYSQDEPYGRWLVDQMVSSAEAAAADLAPARIGAAHGFCNSLSYYERIPITEENAASLGVHPKHAGGVKHSRDHLEARAAAGPIDPQVGVVRIERIDGTPSAVLIHFTAHPAVEIGPPHVSPDYVGFTAKRIQREIPGVVPLFCQGADGAVNINNIFGTLDHARQHGETLADEVLRVLDSIEMTGHVDATSARGTSHLEYSPIPTQEEIDEELAICQGYLDSLERNPDEVWRGYGRHTINLPPDFSSQARRRMEQLRMAQLQSVRSKAGHVFPPAPIELTLFRWNDIALVFNPLELFVQLGLEVKRRSPHRYTFPVGYSGGGPGGYIGTAEEVGRGGYHFAYFNPARRAPGNGERLVADMLELVRQ